MVYSFRDFERPVSANIIGHQIETLQERDGFVTKESLLNSARAESSPIHSCFEWDDKKAGERYRLHQAGQIIMNITVVHEDLEQKPVTRAFVNIQAESPKAVGQYIDINTAMSKDEFRATVLSNAIRELSVFRKKYATLSELSGVFAEISKLGVE